MGTCRSANSRNPIKDVSVQLNVTDQHSRDEEANQVQVPPDIVDDRITGDVIDNEGDNVTLTCIAKGKLNPRGVVKTTKKSRSGTKIFKKWQ
ncbi:Lachesin-like protein [Daphnia magna]|uniref:Lachesin-like protein n=1 Tax=Daphnia magna TaxID=35525 RepID=A0A0P5GKR4_9CRUS|nr:Lachesin-like protein [Daphnia magna]